MANRNVLLYLIRNSVHNYSILFPLQIPNECSKKCKTNFYRSTTKYGKVIFSVKSVHQSVILSTGAGGPCTRLLTPFVQDLPSWTCSNLVDMDLIVSCPPLTRHIQTCSLRRTVGKCVVGI